MREECNNFNTCSAPICPLCGKEENENYTWFPDEETCTKNNAPVWGKRQKKIVKMNSDKNRYFTFEMLKHSCIIGRGMQGLDPDQAESHQLKQWFKKHPKKREISEEERQKKSENMKVALKVKKER
jgi:hypothetical protein